MRSLFVAIGITFFSLSGAAALAADPDDTVAGLVESDPQPTLGDPPSEEGSNAVDAAEGADVAEDTNSLAREFAVEQIVVTARRREELEQQVPVAMTVLGEKQLESSFNRDLSDITGYAPNVIINPVRVGPSGTAISIRGISFQDIEKSFDPGVGVLIDDVFLGVSTGSLVSNFDVGSIEVLRGPQGTLFGKNTIGGAVRITRTRPTGEFGVKASITGGAYGRNDYRVLFNAPVIEDVLAAKAWFYSENDDGSMYNTTKGRWVGGQNYWTAGLTLEAKPTDNLTILGTYEHIRDDTPTLPLINLSQYPGESKYLPGGDLQCREYGQCSVDNLDRITTQNFSDRSRMDLDSVTVQADLDLGDIGTLTSITGWRGHVESVNADMDASAIDYFSVLRDQTYDQVSEEVRLATEEFAGFQLVAGLYLWWAQFTLDQTSYFLTSRLDPGLPRDTDLVLKTGQETFSIAPFFQVDYAITDWLTATAGLRFTWEQKRLTRFDQSVHIGPAVIPIVSDAGQTAHWNAPTPMAGFDAQITDEAMTYFLYSRGFKSGGYNVRAGSIESLGPYDPEYVDSMEVGLKSDWFEDRLRANASLFWNIYDDKQEEILSYYPESPVGQQTFVENAAKARTRGVELELIAVLLPDLTLRQSFGYLDASYIDGEFIYIVDGGEFREPFSSQQMRRAPKFQYSIFVDYVREIGPGLLNLHLDWRWIDQYQTSFPNIAIGEVPANSKLNLLVGYTMPMPGNEDWTLRLEAFGRNVNNPSVLGQTVSAAGLFTFGALPPPRTWGIEMQVAWN
jgi:iron complex outermembrane receptor protein